MVVENRACDGGVVVVWVAGFKGFPISGFMGSDLLVAMVVWVVGICGFLISGFMGSDLLVVLWWFGLLGFVGFRSMGL